MKPLPLATAVLAAVVALAGCSSNSAGAPPVAPSTSTAPAAPVKVDVWERPAAYTSSDDTPEGWQSYDFYDGRISFRAPAGWAAEQSDTISSVTAPDEAASITILYVTEAKAASFGGKSQDVTEASAKDLVKLYESSDVAPADIRGAANGFYLTADKSTLSDDDSHVGGVFFQLPDADGKVSGLVQITQKKPIESEVLNAILASVVVK